ncbi:MAG: cytochrome c3 family protein [Phycisphaeraceae bacterium]|nr:cytochrome c3 family protein [Phycisphaeraceae bacterium]MCB9847385.1 cytochrome c3 family protein [Phycisphaeraceae bacterium]
MEQFKVSHEPVQKQQCLECHEYTDEVKHLFSLQESASALCLRCHTIMQGTSMHEPITSGDCLSCHSSHGSEFPGLLALDPLDNLCTRCHEEDYSKRLHIHGPVAARACVICHKPHSSGWPALLREPADRLCLGCHDGFDSGATSKQYKHEPVVNGCTTCHDPHASDSTFQLTQDVPGLCFECHESIERSIGLSPVVHGPTLEAFGCTRCHSPHGSALPKLQRRPQPEGCLQCHNQEIRTADGKTLTNMARLLAENPDHHGPIREGSCTFCHHPHAGDHTRLLIKDYPPEFYAPFVADRYALCFSCHAPEMVTDEAGFGVTQFRDGNRNLHRLHVNQEKGRTCRACHEVHASKHQFHIRDAVPFGPGGWMLPINFEVTPTGGSCAPGCHEPRSYNR